MTDQDWSSFDHNSCEYARDWRSVHARMRAADGLVHSDTHGGFWVAARYDDVVAVAADDESYYNGRDESGSAPCAGAFIPTTPVGLIPIESDNPVHRDIRRSINAAFSPGVAKAWRPFVRAVTDHMIDKIIESGQCDLVRDVTAPVPAIVNFTLLDLPYEELADSIDAPRTLNSAAPDSEEFKAALRTLEKADRTIRGILADRREHPRKDLISWISVLKVQDQQAQDDVLVNLVQALISGGNGTTTSLISHSLLWLSQHPEERARLRANPQLINPAVEEFLRYFSPVQNLARNARCPVDLGGAKLREGDRVLMAWAAANHDEQMFPEAERVDLARPSNRHLAFGVGAHRCIGSNIARMMGQVVISTVVERMPDFVIDGSGAEFAERIPVVNAVHSLPTAFTPGRPLGIEIPETTPELPAATTVDEFVG